MCEDLIVLGTRTVAPVLSMQLWGSLVLVVSFIATVVTVRWFDATPHPDPEAHGDATEVHHLSQTLRFSVDRVLLILLALALWWLGPSPFPHRGRLSLFIASCNWATGLMISTTVNASGLAAVVCSGLVGRMYHLPPLFYKDPALSVVVALATGLVLDVYIVYRGIEGGLRGLRMGIVAGFRLVIVVALLSYSWRNNGLEVGPLLAIPLEYKIFEIVVCSNILHELQRWRLRRSVYPSTSSKKTE